MKIFLPFMLGFFLYGCSPHSDNAIYIPGREFLYEVEILRDTTLLKTHVICLKVPSEGVSKFTYGQTGIQYRYETLEWERGDTLIETTGVVENDEKIYLHPPRKDFMAFAEIPPQPQISLPLKVGKYSEIQLEIGKGWGQLTGKNIKQTLKITGRDQLNLFGRVYDSLWVIEGANTNYLKELGQYGVIYWFHQEYGFVRMHYTKPDGSTVDLKLKEVR